MAWIIRWRAALPRPMARPGTAAQQAHDNLSRGPVANFAAHHMMYII
jgi:hypothetical protein